MLKSNVLKHVESTFISPEIMICEDGAMVLLGTSGLSDPFAFYQPFTEMVCRLQTQFITIECDVCIKDESNFNALFNLLKAARENPKVRVIRCFWIYDPNDENGYDNGRKIEKLLDIPCDFIEYA